MGWIGSLKAKLPEHWQTRLVRWRRPRSWYLLFGGTRPISSYAGRERGEPIDRYYIERFLATHAADIHGRVLEVKDDAYTLRFGGSRVLQHDVLDINPANPRATILGDLRQLTNVPDSTYDCFILTQTLQYIDDLDAAVRECHRILKPGGILLATLPCLGKIEGLEPNVSGNFWRFTPHAARYLFSKIFDPSGLEIQSCGNARTGMMFWAGFSQQDVSSRTMECHDPAFALLVTVRAAKAI